MKRFFKLLIVCVLLITNMTACSSHFIGPIDYLEALYRNYMQQVRASEAPTVSEVYVIDRGGEEYVVNEKDVEITESERENYGVVNDFSFIYDTDFHYAYDTLDEFEQIWYDDILKILGSLSTEVALSEEPIKNGLDVENLDKIFQCVLIDHPEVFYVIGYEYTRYTLGGNLVGIDFSGTYDCDYDQATVKKDMIESNMSGILGNAGGLTTDFEKMLYVYNWIIMNTDYVQGATDNQNIYSVLVNGASVCQGYAKSFQYLMYRMGIECTLVQGFSNSGLSHAWNMVKADGSYYYIDVTWGDPDACVVLDGNDDYSEILPEVDYNYFCVTSEDICKNHIIDSVIPLPECVALADNYYVMKDLFFTDFNDAQLKFIIDDTIAGGGENFVFKCATDDLYEAMFNDLITENGIFEFIPANLELSSITYSYNPDFRTITFWVVNKE